MKNLFMTLVVLKMLCFIPSKIYTQNIRYHNLTIDVVDATSNSVFPSRVPFEIVYELTTPKNNNLNTGFKRSSLLANYGYMDLVPKEHHLKNRAIIAQDNLTFPEQYFGLIGVVFLHPLTHVLFAFNGNEEANKLINTHSKNSWGKFNRKYPAVTCTPPDCAAQWDGNN